MNDVGRANRCLEIGLGAFERQAVGNCDIQSSRDGVGVTIVIHRAGG